MLSELPCQAQWVGWDLGLAKSDRPRFRPAPTACGRRIIASRSAPAGTIGYTLSSCSTRKSISTVPSASRARVTTSATSGALLGAQAEQAVRFGQLDEVRAAQRRGRVAPFVEELLPLPDHAEVAVVDHGDVDLDAFLRRGRQLGLRSSGSRRRRRSPRLRRRAAPSWRRSPPAARSPSSRGRRR